MSKFTGISFTSGMRGRYGRSTMKILLATDGSDSAGAALDFLADFPFPVGSEVIVLSVIDWRAYSVESEPGDEQALIIEETRDAVRQETEQSLAVEGERLKTAGWAGTTEIRHGDPAGEIIRAAEDFGVDLVMLGSHGVTGVRRFLLGSVSGRVLEYAPCSVLIVKASAGQKAVPVTASAGASSGEREARWRILLAYDISRSSSNALAMCASLPLGNRAEVTAVSVMPMVTAFRQDIRQQLNAIWQQKKQAVRAALDDAVAVLRRSTPHVRAELREGADVSEEILDLAEQSGADLIMLGCKGQGAVRRFLLGSITSRIARHAHCSVWAVRD